MRHRSGFTLIELLIVVAIITVLASLVLVGMKAAGELQKKALTTQRMQTALTAFAQLGQGEGSAALVIQREACLDGALSWTFEDNSTNKSLKVACPLPNSEYWKKRGVDDPFPATVAPKPFIAQRCGPSGVIGLGPGSIIWPMLSYRRAFDDSQHPYLRFPWGEVPPKEILSPAAVTTTLIPDAFYLRHCSPHRTREILTAAGIIRCNIAGGARIYTEYMTDRATTKDWNDAWGRPLVVGFSMYQPPKNNALDNLNNPSTLDNDVDITLKACLNKYKDSRRVYLSVAAMGRTVPASITEAQLTGGIETDWTGASGIPAQIWSWVVAGDTTAGAERQGICQQGDAIPATATKPACTTGEWTESSWANPPWRGVKVGKLKDVTGDHMSFLSAPIPLN